MKSAADLGLNIDLKLVEIPCQNSSNASSCLSPLAIHAGTSNRSAADGWDYDYDRLRRCIREDRDRLGETLKNAQVMNIDKEIGHNALKLVANIYTLLSASEAVLSVRETHLSGPLLPSSDAEYNMMLDRMRTWEMAVEEARRRVLQVENEMSLGVKRVSAMKEELRLAYTSLDDKHPVVASSGRCHVYPASP